MITFVVADVLHSPAQILVNPVNTVGSMGRGLPRQFKALYPDMYQQYRQMCRSGRFDIGQLWLYKTPHKWILNFPIKAHWRDAARLEYIERGLQSFVGSYAEREFRSVSYPMLSAGLGGLDWDEEVRPLLEHYLDPLPIPVYIHLYESRNPYAIRWEFEDLKNWLYTIPLWPSAETFSDDLRRLVDKQRRWARLDNAAPFEVYADRNGGYAFRSADALEYCSTSADLAALWPLFETPAYVCAEDLPAELQVPAILLFSLLAQLDYLYPVMLERVSGRRQIGLYCVPRHDDGRSRVA
jgi:O-acetyl-ADP-ribose deacetylase (regulator of RNase III)